MQKSEEEKCVIDTCFFLRTAGFPYTRDLWQEEGQKNSFHLQIFRIPKSKKTCKSNLFLISCNSHQSLFAYKVVNGAVGEQLSQVLPPYQIIKAVRKYSYFCGFPYLKNLVRYAVIPSFYLFHFLRTKMFWRLADK